MKKNTRIIIVLALGIGIFFTYKVFEVNKGMQQDIPITQKPSTTTSESPLLSEDKKSIISNEKILLTIDNDTIFNWFKNESQLCDEYNRTNTADRKLFCEEKISFTNQTRFTSITVSPDKMTIGFVIESDTLSPDKVAGIYILSSNKAYLLTSYYLGNKFISFSPSGKYFIYQSNCWEGMCSLFIKDSETLIEKVSLNNPEYADSKSVNAEFIRWVSDNEVEYKLGTVIKQISF